MAPPETATEPSAERAGREPAEAGRTLRILLYVTALTGLPAIPIAATQPGPPVIAYTLAGLWGVIVVGCSALALRLRAPERPPSRSLVRRSSVWLVVGTLAAYVLAGQLRLILLTTVSLVVALFVLALATRPASPRLKKALVATHVMFSGSWVGVGAVMVALALIGMLSGDPELQRFSYKIMEIFDMTVLPLSSVGATLTGVFLSFVTHWGVLRHRWIVTKLVLALVVFTAAFVVLRDWVVRAAEQSAEHAQAEGDGISTALGILLIGGFFIGFVNVGVALVISFYKPWGKTKRGQREAERRGRERRAARTRPAEKPITAAERAATPR